MLPIFSTGRFGSAEVDHVLLGIIVLFDQTLMSVMDHFGDGWESLIEGDGDYNTWVVFRRISRLFDVSDAIQFYLRNSENIRE